MLFLIRLNQNRFTGVSFIELIISDPIYKYLTTKSCLCLIVHHVFKVATSTDSAQHTGYKWDKFEKKAAKSARLLMS